jgi:hypothetical protein
VVFDVIDCPPQYETPRDPARDTLGPAVAVAEALGTPLMPWQRQVADMAWSSTQRRAGWPMARSRSAYLRGKVERGRRGPGSTVAYFEWSAPTGSDPGDPQTWWGCMPALGHTMTEAGST